jgi:uncharacterized LabA/DUF88 family protein
VREASVKTYVYVDAFNLYFGALRRTPYKWLDLLALSRTLLPKHSIDRIKYFTARVAARPSDPDQPTRQATYLRALGTIPILDIYYGHFLTHRVHLPLASPSPGKNKHAQVIRTEEKGSDVNLACQLLQDAYLNRCECAVVISGDSDLLMPVRVVMGELGKPVGIINPQRIPCSVLQREATFYKHLRKSALARCQFPERLKDDKGSFSKPSTW